MDTKALERIFSSERLHPYLKRHNDNFNFAVDHYRANILISEAFYPLISILEIGLRNGVNNQLIKKFNGREWFETKDFVKIASSFQIETISKARNSILQEKKEITPGRIIAELSFGFWTSLFDARYEMTLWKNLRFVFPACPKVIRQRKTISSKLNGIRKLRNRIFHHEAISWDVSVIKSYRNEISEGIQWLDRDLLKWSEDLFRIDDVIEKETEIIDR
jgi:hypothetical protein